MANIFILASEVLHLPFKLIMLYMDTVVNAYRCSSALLLFIVVKTAIVVKTTTNGHDANTKDEKCPPNGKPIA